MRNWVEKRRGRVLGVLAGFRCEAGRGVIPRPAFGSDGRRAWWGGWVTERSLSLEAMGLG